MRERNSLDVKYTWNLEKIYSDLSIFEKDYLYAQDKIKDLTCYEESMLDGAQKFYETVKENIILTA